ncbi:hypothetical protein PR202_gb24307 [Eleusine coracana subsp. coracana]|uniref:phenylalanine--tRNA ligase n=1 Tax=Eleusine coracana subsp. coracana TaxID=191504 RepID=A0AAV5FKQ7_ELECO|nr:hypothetical protein PR202_gb24307 [Eleusine coracana subsp. coracana]
MPTVSVGRDRLFAALGETYTQEAFEKLCFEFGIELDDVTTEKAILRKEKHLDDDAEADGDDEVIYKIEVAANRYDLLCLEGLARALRVFNGTEANPVYKVAPVPRDSMLKMHVKPQTSQIRPYVVCAVLRGITFDEARYNSFIDLQDKLHQNICRKRTLVAIGTHDLDTLQGPFSYEALPPQEINFVPLKQKESFRADTLIEFYKSDMKLKKFLHIIEKSPVFPVIYDSNRTVLSLPPIINGAHSAITLKTRNVFIECTATDLTKANIILNTMVTMFAEYCENKFEVEPVEVMYHDGSKTVYPDLSCYKMEVSLSDLIGPIGISPKVMDEKKIFEVGDVVTLNLSNEVGASNNRRLAALYCNRVSGFEEIMGLVDSIVKVVRADHVKFDKNYYVPTNEPEFFPKRQCKIVMKGGKEVGYLGVVHAEVLRKFGIPDPCTFVEIDIEALL